MGNEVSPALSKLEVRIRTWKGTQNYIRDREFEIQQHQNAIENLELLLAEYRFDEQQNDIRIQELYKEALDEGFTEEYLDRFLKERHYIK